MIAAPVNGVARRDAREVARRVLPHNLDAEASILGGILLRNEVLDRLGHVELDHFYDLRHKVVFQAMRALEHAGRPIDVVTVELELERMGKLEAVGGIGYLGELAGRVPTADNVEHYAESVTLLAKNRRVILELGAAVERAWSWPHDPVELLVETMGQLQRIESLHARRGEPVQAPSPFRFGPELVDRILERAKDPWVSLQLADDELARVRAGSTVVVIGSSGSGKTSLVACMLVQHARDVGPAIALSIELPDDEFGARIVGQKCDASWEDTLRGVVAETDMRRALDLPRLCVLERRRATLANLELAVDECRRRFPGQPILVAIDYAQLLESKEREVRQRVADAFAQIDDCAREKKFVAIALSQMSRLSSTKARSGEAIGAESAALGAETAAIERFATLTFTIGMSAERDDGSEAVELSIGKARMSKGDRVVPMTYWGRSGLWRVAGATRSASEVREQRDVVIVEKVKKSVRLKIIGAAASSPRPVSMNQLIDMVAGDKVGRVKISKNNALKEIHAIIGEGVKQWEKGERCDLVQIAEKAPGSRIKSPAWLLWTEDRALAANKPLVRDSRLPGVE